MMAQQKSGLSPTRHIRQSKFILSRISQKVQPGATCAAEHLTFGLAARAPRKVLPPAADRAPGSIQPEIDSQRGGGFDRLPVQQRGLVAPLLDGIESDLRQPRI